MNDYPKPNVVIGGTNDGRRITVLHGSTVSMPIMRSLSDVAVPLDVQQPVSMNADYRELYRKFPHGIGGQKFCVWVPVEWDDERAGQEIFGRIAKLWAASLAAYK